MSNKLMLLPFALLLSSASTKATHAPAECSYQAIHKPLQDEDLLDSFDAYSLLDFMKLEPAKDFKAS